MSDYTDIITAWDNLWNSYYFQDMPFFRAIIHFFLQRQEIRLYYTPRIENIKFAL